ncbi:MAG: type II toxin-antitoxin system RelE family toxin [Gammaproteobacteria bacterium]
MWSIEFSREAVKALVRMPRDQAVRIRRKIDELARDPANAPNVKKLTEHPGYRLRVGDWRVVYLLLDDRLVVQVVRIAPRGEVYR